MKCSVVIGMNYGDEGKGHLVNRLADSDSLVVRFNGGPQAAHRVLMNDGREHVFRHFGSGVMSGARTLLASHFLVNPVLFLQELSELKAKTPVAPVLIDPRCRVTTHYDMLINAFQADQTGVHNTVGVGINETVERSRFYDLTITFGDLAKLSELELLSIIDRIANDWIPFRLEQLSLNKDLFVRFAASKGVSDWMDKKFIATAKWLSSVSATAADDEVITKFLKKDYRRSLVFEGAQGLRLDQNRKDNAKYLTRSSTDIRNVWHALSAVQVPIDVNVILVSRAYMTRHGAGPLLGELPGKPYDAVEDARNPENQFQGKMRYAYLDDDWIHSASIEAWDWLDKKPDCIESYRVQTAVTCLDQLDEYVPEDPLKSQAKTVDGKLHEVGELFSDIGFVSERCSESGWVKVQDRCSV